jgi:hypothetical protein
MSTSGAVTLGGIADKITMLDGRLSVAQADQPPRRRRAAYQSEDGSGRRLPADWHYPQLVRLWRGEPFQ